MGGSVEPVARVPARPLSPWLVWWAAVASSLFIAWSWMPSAYLFAGLVRPGAADLRVRLDMFWMQYYGLTGISGWIEDPVRGLQTAIGLAAGVSALLMAGIVAIRVARSRGTAWPASGERSSAWYWSAQAGLGLAMTALAVLALVAPVPARPLGWWFLALAGASAALWLSGRRRALAPASCVLSASASIALLVDVLFPPTQAVLAPSGWLELLAFAATAAASVGCVALMLRSAAAAPDEGADGTGRGVATVAATVLAALFGVMVIAISASGSWVSPTLPFGPVRGRQVVVLAPHMDDEAAFAGETVSWLSRNGANVTVVFTTDSRGGRALDKDPAYISRRKAAGSAVAAQLGVSRVVVFDEVRDGNRMRGPRKVATIARRVAELGLVRPGTILITVSGTGHSDHLATFTAALSIARSARLPLLIAWGYDDAHDAIATPDLGRPLPIDGGPAALADKAAAVDRYIWFFQDHYPTMLPRVLLSSRGAHDTLSVVYPPAGTAGSAQNGDPVKAWANRATEDVR